MTLGLMFKYIHAAVSILLVLAILVQTRSSGLSSALGGSGAVKVQKRGAEKVLYQTTIVLAVLFIGFSIGFLFVR